MHRVWRENSYVSLNITARNDRTPISGISRPPAVAGGMRAVLTRRQLIARSATVLPLAAMGSGVLIGSSGGIKTSPSPGFLDAVAEIVIPGAKQAMVGDYMTRAFAHGLFDSDAMTAGTLEALLDSRLKGRFMTSPQADQVKVIWDLDTEVFGQAGTAASTAQDGTGQPPSQEARLRPAQLWRSTKTAIIVGFYMSEIGASKELRYELVPGQFDPDIPYKPGDTYLSNNWNANIG